MVKDGQPAQDLPNERLLTAQVDKYYSTNRKGLLNGMDAARAIKENYNYRIVQHLRPSLKYPAEVEKFDKFIERRAAEVPLAAFFETPPSYHTFLPRSGDKVSNLVSNSAFILFNLKRKYIGKL